MDVEEVVSSYEKLLVSFAKVTDRIKESTLRDAVKDIFNPSEGECNMFAERLVNAFSFCRKKCFRPPLARN